VARVSRHLALPLRLTAAGALATVAEDSLDEIAQNAAVVLRTRRGERLATPELGTDDPTFAGLDVDVALSIVGAWEPRADLALVEQVLDRTGYQRTEIAVRRRAER
jgi:phage baseplate assembly protein W